MKAKIKPEEMTPEQKAYCTGVLDILNKLYWKVPIEVSPRLEGYAQDLFGFKGFDVNVNWKNEEFKIKGLR